MPQGFSASGTKSPCPICGRTSEGCRVQGELLYCRIGTTCSPLIKHPHLKTGQVINGWACVSINPDTECASFKIHTEREPRRVIKTHDWTYRYIDGRPETATRFRKDYNWGEKDCHWSKGTRAAELLPLYYDELPESGSGEYIFLVEGEKACDAMRECGLVATSVPNGSGTWRSGVPDLTKFVGNVLVLCPDRDRTGIELMERVAAAYPDAKWLLAQPTAKSEWATPDDGYDVGDWIEDGADAEKIIRSIRGNAPVIAAAPWPERLAPELDEEGKPVRLSPMKLARKLNKELGQAIAWNNLSDEIELDGAGVEDPEFRTSYMDMEDARIRVSKEIAQDAMVRAARMNRYHPVEQYLDSCNTPLPDDVWDNIASHLLGGEAEPFDNSALRKWLIFAVARIYEPGCPCGFIHILSGEQHHYKTRFYNTLASEPWFFEGFVKSNRDHDDICSLHTRWICEWGELDGGVKNHESSALKNFITRKTDIVREAYGRGQRERKRQFVLCGTTNKVDGFFSDETGNRRFVIYPIKEQINSARVLSLRDQIWSSAKRDYLAGKEWYLNTEENAINNERNRSKFAQDPWSVMIASHTASKTATDYYLAEDILAGCCEVPKERQTQQHLTRVNRILTSLGYKKSRKMLNGVARSIWRRPV